MDSQVVLVADLHPQIGAALLNRTVAPVDKAPTLFNILLGAAEAQVIAETNDDSPWSPEDDDDIENEVVKQNTFDNEVAGRMLEIAQNLKETLNICIFEVSVLIHKRRLDLFPSDGVWVDLASILRSRLGEATGGSPYQVAQFIERSLPVLENADVRPKDVAKIAASNFWGLGVVSSAVNAVLKTDLKPKEKKARLHQVVKDALTLTKEQLETKYVVHRIPAIKYDVQHLGNGRATVVMHLTEAQLSLFRRRLGARAARTEGSLFEVVTPELVIERDWGRLLRAAVMADKVRAVALGILEANPGKWTNLDFFLGITTFPPQEIKRALGELVRYEIVEVAKTGNILMWRKRT